MSLKDQKILKTLEMLAMLSRSRQQFSHGLSEEEKATIKITKQFINDAGLTIPEFTNSLHELSEKGYVWHVVIFDDELRAQMDDLINSDLYETVLQQLTEKSTDEMSKKLKQSTIQQIEKTLPRSVEFDHKEVMNEVINLPEAFNTGIEFFKSMRPDEMAMIILMPFRDIQTLIKKMSDGERFEDIEDDGFWYDKNKFEFHIDNQIIPTSYQNKPNLEHYILCEFYDDSKTSSVDYEELSNFDVAKGEEAYRDAMRRFVSKHPSLSRIFTVHKYNTEFHPHNY